MKNLFLNSNKIVESELDISDLSENFSFNDTFCKSVRTLKGLNVKNAKYIDLEKFTALQNIEIKLKVIEGKFLHCDDQWVCYYGMKGDKYNL